MWRGRPYARPARSSTTGWTTCVCAASCICCGRTSGSGHSRTASSAPLLARDADQRSRLVELLRCFCEQGGNKSAAAAAAHLSRTAYYQQLSRIAQVLGVSLDDPESMLSLYVALLVRELDDA